MGILYKQGVDGRFLDTPIRKILKTLSETFGDVIVTSTNESAAGRREDSLHYTDCAIDIRNYAVLNYRVVPIPIKILRALLPIGYDIVPYGNFYHIEWDPKNTRRGRK